MGLGLLLVLVSGSKAKENCLSELSTGWLIMQEWCDWRRNRGVSKFRFLLLPDQSYLKWTYPFFFLSFCVVRHDRKREGNGINKNDMTWHKDSKSERWKKKVHFVVLGSWTQGTGCRVPAGSSMPRSSWALPGPSRKEAERTCGVPGYCLSGVMQVWNTMLYKLVFILNTLVSWDFN